MATCNTANRQNMIHIGWFVCLIVDRKLNSQGPNTNNWVLQVIPVSVPVQHLILGRFGQDVSLGCGYVSLRTTQQYLSVSPAALRHRSGRTCGCGRHLLPSSPHRRSSWTCQRLPKGTNVYIVWLCQSEEDWEWQFGHFTVIYCSRCGVEKIEEFTDYMARDWFFSFMHSVEEMLWCIAQNSIKNVIQCRASLNLTLVVMKTTLIILFWLLWLFLR